MKPRFLLASALLLAALGAVPAARASAGQGFDYPERDVAAFLGRLEAPATGVYTVTETGYDDFDRNGIKERYFFVYQVESDGQDEEGSGPDIIEGPWFVVVKGKPGMGRVMFQLALDEGTHGISFRKRPGPISSGTRDAIAAMKKLVEAGGNPGTAEFFPSYKLIDLTGDGRPELVLSLYSMGVNTGWERLTIFCFEKGRWRRALKPVTALWDAGFEDLDGNGTTEVIVCPGYLFHRLYPGSRFDWAEIYTFRNGRFVMANREFPKEFPLKYIAYLDEAREFGVVGKGTPWGVFDWEADLREAQIYDYNGKAEDAARWYNKALDGITRHGAWLAEQSWQDKKEINKNEKLAGWVRDRINELAGDSSPAPPD